MDSCKDRWVGERREEFDRLTINVASTAQQLRAFLRAVHASPLNKHGVLYVETPQLRAAICTYCNSFMPAAAERGAAALGPPRLDVAWVWFLHRLAPVSYCRDCLAAFGKVVDADPACPLAFVDGDLSDGCDQAPQHGMTLTCDIAATAERQGAFLWQVRWPDYDQAEFLADACSRYTKLLRLWSTSRSFLVPTYDQDLMWHAHMCHPVAYAADCLRLCGRPIDHDDSVTDRSAGSKLSTGAEITSALWAQAYPGETWHKQGGMFRGHPPDWYWQYPQIAAMLGGPVPPVEITDPKLCVNAEEDYCCDSVLGGVLAAAGTTGDRALVAQVGVAVALAFALVVQMWATGRFLVPADG